MDILSPRQSDILVLAREAGRVEVEGLATKFEVTPQTIRKDLNDLCERSLLQRIHGGAVVSSGFENVGYEARRGVAAEEKSAIGRLAASLIPNDCSLIINIGTTTEQVAYSLTSHHELRVITNNTNVANILRRAPGIEVLIAGGLVRSSDGGIVGAATVDFINQFKVDYAVIGVSAIDEDGALLDYDFHEVRVAQAIIANARHVMLVSDQLKLARAAPYRIGDISQIGTFVTDAPLPERLAEKCHQSGVIIKMVELT
ncbi:MAG: DeoR/GlpR family DNA-binding transcription regulator [Alphaproteobacteria bacterium]